MPSPRNKRKKCIVDMNHLIEWIRDFLADTSRHRQNVHHQCCVEAAEFFDLWDESNAIPIWLSRIVAGEMTDRGMKPKGIA
jgi:hypothetical protein